MEITLEQISAADMMLSKLGIVPEEYVAAKQTAIPFPKPDDVPASPFLSRQEAANLLRCSVDTLDNLISAGKIKSSKLSSARCGRVLVDRKSLLAFVHRCTTSSKREVHNGRR